MQASEVEIHIGGTDRQYRALRQIEVKRSKATAFSADPTIEEINSELRRKAAEWGANGVINVQYKRGMSLTSYGVLTAVGTAVVFDSDEVDCPFCAEKIKRAAIKCKHCGATIEAREAEPSTVIAAPVMPSVTTKASPPAIARAVDPSTDGNNVWLWVGVVGVVFILVLLKACG